MTVAELITKLQQLEPTLDVVIYNPDKDYMTSIYEVKELDEIQKKYYECPKGAVKLWDGN